MYQVFLSKVEFIIFSARYQLVHVPFEQRKLKAIESYTVVTSIECRRNDLNYGQYEERAG